MKALSGHCNLPLLTVTPSSLLRKWVGDTPQLVRALFSLAKKLEPCIIFVDEMDSLFRARFDGDGVHDRNLKMECKFLKSFTIAHASSTLIPVYSSLTFYLTKNIIVCGYRIFNNVAPVHSYATVGLCN